VRLNHDQAEARTAISSSASDRVEIPGHRRAMNTHRPSVLIDASTFVKDDHQKGDQRGQRYGPAQIA
jgi:hypothetical protein